MRNDFEDFDFVGDFSVWSIVSSVGAQTCGALPYQLTHNGSTADASQVMANFTHVVNFNNNLAGFFRGWLAGLTLSNNSSSP